jgi:hypothetical protein
VEDSLARIDEGVHVPVAFGILCIAHSTPNRVMHEVPQLVHIVLQAAPLACTSFAINFSFFELVRSGQGEAGIIRIAIYVIRLHRIAAHGIAKSYQVPHTPARTLRQNSYHREDHDKWDPKLPRICERNVDK